MDLTCKISLGESSDVVSDDYFFDSFCCTYYSVGNGAVHSVEDGRRRSLEESSCVDAVLSGYDDVGTAAAAAAAAARTYTAAVVGGGTAAALRIDAAAAAACTSVAAADDDAGAAGARTSAAAVVGIGDTVAPLLFCGA